MTQSEAKSSKKLAPEEGWDGKAEVLDNDTGNTEQCCEEDGLLSTNEIRDEPSSKCRNEEADCGSSIENLLIPGRDEQLAVDLMAEFLKERCHGEKIADCANLVAKVYREQEDQKALGWFQSALMVAFFCLVLDSFLQKERTRRFSQTSFHDTPLESAVLLASWMVGSTGLASALGLLTSLAAIVAKRGMITRLQGRL